MNGRNYRVSLVVMSSLMVVLFSTVFYEFEQNNFHLITAGEAYRSAQPDGAELAYYIRKYHIKSVLNLRGANPGETWYTDELSVSSKNNVAHYDISLSAYQEPQEKDIRTLTDIFVHAPRPLLIHCQAGADRSGLVAAMWKEFVDKEPKAEAMKQLSIFFGHLSVGSASAMDTFFEKWNPAPLLENSSQNITTPVS
jgi:protein tyrosine phosphatase (PTP) superfamily phosphohydrolase (DUF442 family)